MPHNFVLRGQHVITLLVKAVRPKLPIGEGIDGFGVDAREIFVEQDALVQDITNADLAANALRIHRA